jgi:hypothetical protein
LRVGLGEVEVGGGGGVGGVRVGGVGGERVIIHGAEWRFGAVAHPDEALIVFSFQVFEAMG